MTKLQHHHDELGNVTSINAKRAGYGKSILPEPEEPRFKLEPVEYPDSDEVKKLQRIFIGSGDEDDYNSMAEAVYMSAERRHEGQHQADAKVIEQLINAQSTALYTAASALRLAAGNNRDLDRVCLEGLLANLSVTMEALCHLYGFSFIGPRTFKAAQLMTLRCHGLNEPPKGN